VGSLVVGAGGGAVSAGQHGECLSSVEAGGGQQYDSLLLVNNSPSQTHGCTSL
jgi:hypothetical protein